MKTLSGKKIPCSSIVFVLFCIEELSEFWVFVSITSCNIQFQDFNLDLGHFGCFTVDLLFCLVSAVCHHWPYNRSVALLLSGHHFQDCTYKVHLTTKKLNLSGVLLNYFYSVPVDLGEMETESVRSNSTESQTSSQDNDVSLSVICINAC